MKTQIPIYRAKKIDSDEEVEGYYYPIRCIGTDITEPSIVSADLNDAKYDDYFTINPSTLAIHFPDMIDSEGTKIFASLSEDGNGGDVCKDIKNDENSSVVLFQDYRITFKEDLSEDRDFFDLLVRSRLKVTGIQQ